MYRRNVGSYQCEVVLAVSFMGIYLIFSVAISVFLSHIFLTLQGKSEMLRS